MGNLTAEEKINQIKSRLPAKLKVIAEAWNPVLELLALAFDNGKIMAKAIDRKTCWKRSLAEDDGILKDIWKTPSGGTFIIHSMAWSPDGEILAVSMDNKKIHMLAAASGKIGYTVDGRESYEKLVWERILPQPIDEIKDASLSFATASSFDFNDEAPKECAQQIADMEDYFHRHFNSFYGTALLGVTEDALLHIYVGGIMFCHELNVLHHHEFGSNSDTHSLLILDCIVDKDTKKVEVLYQITEMEESEIVNNSFLFKYDLGWNRETFATLSIIAASFYKINFLLIFLREMVRYTAHGLEESTENLYQKVIRVFHTNYKMTMNSPWTFFHEMMQHLTGNSVSLAYFDSLRKARSGATGPLHFSKQITEYNEKRLGTLDTGIQIIALAVETIIGLYRCIIDNYSTDFTYVEQFLSDEEQPKMDHSKGLNLLTSYYCDLIVFQKLIESIRTVIEKKRLGFQYLSYYLTQVNTKNEENFRGHLTVYLENINLAAFCDFLGEALVHSDVRIPTSILHNVLAKVPSLENPPNPLQSIREISDMTEPFGYYPLPRYVAACNNTCPHNSKYLNAESEQAANQVTPSNKDLFQDNPRKTNPLVSVYLWRTEKIFDFFSKFFPEYGSAKYPPQGMLKLMESKLESIIADKKYHQSLELIFGKEKHSLVYEIDRIEYMAKMALRPTVFLGLMPLFSFENTIVNIISNQYPGFIHGEYFAYNGVRLERQQSTDSENMEAIIAACSQIPGDDFENRWPCDQNSVKIVQEKFLTSTRNFLMGYEL